MLDAKLAEIVHKDLHAFSSLEPALTGFDACFFCLGVASAGMNEADYRRVTFDITLAAATTLARLNPRMAFVYVSGAGADSRARSRSGSPNRTDVTTSSPSIDGKHTGCRTSSPIPVCASG